MQNNLLQKLMTVGLALMFVVSLLPLSNAAAQETRSIVPSPRTVTVETVDPTTGMPKNSFCAGVNTIDIRLTNDTGYAQTVYVFNRDTRGIQRTLFNGQLQPGATYLSRLLNMKLSLNGPAGTEMVWITSDMLSAEGSRQTTYYVQDCGGATSGTGAGNWQQNYGYAQVWAQISPSVIAQGQKAVIVAQTSVGAQQGAGYYLEILNSWGQLWKRIPVTKAPYDYYQVTLPIGTKTKPGVLTYTVNVVAAGYGQSQKIGTTQFSFQIVTPGSLSVQPPYNQGYEYQGQPWSQGMMPYGATPNFNAGGYETHPSFVMPPYSPYSTYGMNPTATGGAYKEERQIQ